MLGGWCVTFRRREMNHIPITLKHIDLFDLLNRLHVHLLERRLQFLIVCAGALMNLLYFSARCAFASA